MDATTIGQVLKVAFEQWGLTALFLCLMAIMIAVSTVQAVQIRRWAPQTKEIAGLLRENITVLHTIVSKLDTQHTSCTQHYAMARQQIEGMASIGNELRSVVDNIAQSDRARNQEVLQLMAAILARHPA